MENHLYLGALEFFNMVIIAFKEPAEFLPAKIAM